VRPPIVKSMMKPMAYIMGALRRMSALWSVPSQLKTFTAEGIATAERDQAEYRVGQGRLAADEHVVAPHEEAQHRDRDGAHGDERVAKMCLRLKATINSLITPMAGRIMM